MNLVIHIKVGILDLHNYLNMELAVRLGRAHQKEMQTGEDLET